MSHIRSQYFHAVSEDLRYLAVRQGVCAGGKAEDVFRPQADRADNAGTHHAVEPEEIQGFVSPGLSKQDVFQRLDIRIGQHIQLLPAFLASAAARWRLRTSRGSLYARPGVTGTSGISSCAGAFCASSAFASALGSASVLDSASGSAWSALASGSGLSG